MSGVCAVQQSTDTHVMTEHIKHTDTHVMTEHIKHTDTHVMTEHIKHTDTVHTQLKNEIP